MHAEDPKIYHVTRVRLAGFLGWAIDNVRTSRGDNTGEALGSSNANYMLAGIQFLQRKQLAEYPEWFGPDRELQDIRKVRISAQQRA